MRVFFMGQNSFNISKIDIYICSNPIMSSRDTQDNERIFLENWISMYLVFVGQLTLSKNDY